MTPAIRPRRSALYVPASNERALRKARILAADVVILDLEDGVAPDDKSRARDTAEEAIAALSRGKREIAVRINGLATPWVARDLAIIAGSGANAIVVPKVSDVDDIRRIRSALAAAGAPRTLQLWAMIETPAAILNAQALAAVAAEPDLPLTCLVLGTNDLAAELGVSYTPDRAGLVPHIAHMVLVARANGLSVLDGTFNSISDDQGLAAECRQGKVMGLDGKTLIHPSQITTANLEFGPSRTDIEWAQQVVDAFADPENTTRSVLKVDGQMVERLHERRSRRTLAMAKAIRELEA